MGQVCPQPRHLPSIGHECGDSWGVATIFKVGGAAGGRITWCGPETPLGLRHHCLGGGQRHTGGKHTAESWICRSRLLVHHRPLLLLLLLLLDHRSWGGGPGRLRVGHRRHAPLQKAPPSDHLLALNAGLKDHGQVGLDLDRRLARERDRDLKSLAQGERLGDWLGERLGEWLGEWLGDRASQ